MVQVSLKKQLDSIKDNIKNIYGHKSYIFSRGGRGCAVLKVHTGNLLDPRLDLVSHSPDGFEWGYMGSGPAQLALALLADFTEDDEFALKHYQEFKRTFVGKWKQEDFLLEKEEIENFIKKIE